MKLGLKLGLTAGILSGLLFNQAQAFDPDKYNRTRALRWGLVKDREVQSILKPTWWRGKPVPGARVELRAFNTNNYNIYKDGEYIGWREDRKIGDNLGELRVVRSDHWSDWYSRTPPYKHAKVKLYKAGEELARTNPEALITRLKTLEPSFDYEIKLRTYRNLQTGETITKPYVKIIKPSPSSYPSTP